MIKLLARYVKPLIFMLVLAVCLLAVQAYGDLTLPEYMSKIVNVGIQQGGIESATPIKARQETMAALLRFMTDGERAVIADSYDLADGVYSLKPKYDKARLEEIFSGAMVEMVKMSAQAAGRDMSGMTDGIALQSAISYLKTEYEAVGVDLQKIQMDFILKTGGMMLLLSLMITAAAVSANFFGARIAATLARDVRKDVFTKVVGFSNAEFDTFSTASLITRSTNDVQQIQQMLPMLVRVVIYAPIMGIGGVFKVMNTETSMTWIIALAVAVLIVLVLAMFKIALPKFTGMQKLVDKVNLVMRESLTGMLVIRAFNTQKHEEKRFEAASADLRNVNMFVGNLMSTMMPAMTIIMNFTMLLIVWVGASNIEAGTMQVGDMMAFIQYAMQIIMSFLFISMISVMLPRASVAADRIMEVLNSDSSVKDAAKPEKFKATNRGEVEFKNVSFKYPNAEDYVLEDISFTAHAGQTTAFIGSTGSGKSTLINLIPRFYDVTGGTILINGTDIRTVRQTELRERIGYVPQRGVLFTGTVESNIKFGGKGITDEQMLRAAEIAQADAFIAEKPERYNEPISQDGANVSGGQKQRLSIARALAKNPDIYIFDDSFSALDFKTDKELRGALAKELGGATVLIVAQRIGTIKNADRIVVLDEGRIVGIGRHSELLKACDVYRQIALSQLSQEELDRDMEAAAPSAPKQTANNGKGALAYE